MQSRFVRRLAVAGTAVFAALVLAACGGDHGMDHGGDSPTGGSPAGDGSFNDADVTFATHMIPHHEQAVEMARAAASKAGNPQVKDLAAKIMAAQGPEIDTMSGWLRRWGRPVSSGGHDMPGMDMSSGMPGMMSSREMADLNAASGAAFDAMFLQMMIRHHQGAITMADTERQQGKDAAARQLATKIAADQAAEITQMRNLLTTLS